MKVSEKFYFIDAAIFVSSIWLFLNPLLYMKEADFYSKLEILKEEEKQKGRNVDLEKASQLILIKGYLTLLFNLEYF